MTKKARLAVLATTLAMTIALGLSFSPGTGLAQTEDLLEKEMRAAHTALEEAIPRAAADATRPMATALAASKEAGNQSKPNVIII